ncbi:MAG: hypothetical protein PVH77_04000 [Phycisphaerales bacterium]|jgi:hypothetical protein
MNMIPADTTIEAARKQFEILRRLGPEERLKMAFEMSNNLHGIVEAGVRKRHPDWNEETVRRRVLYLMIGKNLYREVFGDEAKFE